MEPPPSAECFHKIESMIKQLIVVVLVIFAIVAVVAMRTPDTFRVERSIVIKASAEKVFALINDFHNFGAWSPWEKLDPNMVRTLSGSPSGTGAVYQWRGNAKAGAGRMEIIESQPSTKVRMRLDFLKPFKSTSTADYLLEPQPDSTTRVTWSMYGPSAFASKVMQVFITMDSMLGGDFETGLQQMKAAAEK